MKQKALRIGLVLFLCLSLLGLPSPARAASSSYIWPYANGTSFKYNENGIHVAGFSSFGGVDGWVAIDLVSDGDTGSGHAPNIVYAMASGTVQWVCKDSTSEAFRLGDLIYAHLQLNNIKVGDHYDQGQIIGPLVVGAFNDTCGYSNMESPDFHIHLGFPPGTLTVGDWTLDSNTGIWSKGSDHAGPGSWITAFAVLGGGGPGGQISTEPTIFTFMLGGVTWFINTLILPLFGNSADQLAAVNFGSAISKNMMVVLQLVWLAFGSFNLFWFGLYLAVVFTLKTGQLIVSIYLFIKRLIPVAG